MASNVVGLVGLVAEAAGLAKMAAAVQPAAWVGRLRLVGVGVEEGASRELGLEEQHHSQRDVGALEHPCYHWPEQHWQV